MFIFMLIWIILILTQMDHLYGRYQKGHNYNRHFLTIDKGGNIYNHILYVRDSFQILNSSIAIQNVRLEFFILNSPFEI